MATQEEINQIARDNRTFINSLIANSKLPSELASKTSITSSNDVAVVQNGLSDAEKVDIALTRGSLGGWNASTNDPSLVNGTGIGGDKYTVTTAGTQDFGDGDKTFSINDFVEYQNGKWIVGLNIETGAIAVDGVVTINTASDFPAAVGGVIELAPAPGVELTYVLGVNEIDIGSDEFMNTGGDIVIIGTHRTASGIASTTSNTLFTSVDGFLALEFIGVTAPNAQIIDFTTPVATFKSFVANNLIVRDCDTIGTIDGAFTSSLRTMTVVASQTGGLLWTGTDSSQINISNFLGLSWAGTLLDLGTATFDIIDIGGGNRFVSPSGATILSGAASSANLTATGRGIVDNNLFNGIGTALGGGLDTEQLKWTFNDNIWADNSTKDTEVVADAFLTSSTTVTIGSIGVYVAVAGVNWVTDISKRFTVSTAGLVTYIGLETIDIVAGVTSTVEKVGGGSDTICTKIAINGTVSDKTVGCTENATPTGVVSTGLFEIETGDTIQLFVGNEGSTSNIIVSTCNLIVNER